MATHSKVVKVVPYDPSWQEAFANIRDMIQSYIGDLIVRIEHVGSTSVPGLSAKPVIDLDVVIESNDLLSEIVERLAKQGYQHQGNLGIEGREAFQRTVDDDHMTYHLYVCPQDSRELRRHILFRDYLRKHPEARDGYQALKVDLAEKYRYDIDTYCEMKTDFITGILVKAKQEE